jgi:hypothetical protein
MNGKKPQRFWRHLRSYTSNGEFPQMDPTTPWYNFNLYVDCCNSLGFKPSITSYIRYNEYYKALFTEK